MAFFATRLLSVVGLLDAPSFKLFCTACFQIMVFKNRFLTEGLNFETAIVHQGSYLPQFDRM